MLIKDLEIAAVEVPLLGTYKTAHNTRTTLKSVIVRVHGDNGLEGIGNIDPAPGYMKETVADVVRNIRKVSPLIVGNSVYNIFFLLKLLDDNLRDNYCSKAAIEMGLLDLMAKSLKSPFHKIISDGFRNEIPLMGWIGQGTAEEAAAKALDFAEKGFTGLKVKVGRNVEGDVQRIKAIRNAVGDEIAVRIDANESYNEDETISLLKSIDDLNIQLCEQPIPRDDHKGLARIRNKTGIPIMADESVFSTEDFLNLIRADAVDIIKVKVMKHGGIIKTLNMMNMAREAGIRCVIGHGFNLLLNATAEAFLAGISDNVLFPGEMVGPLKLRDDIFEGGGRIERGKFLLSGTEDGFGVALHEDKFNKYRLREEA